MNRDSVQKSVLMLLLLITIAVMPVDGLLSSPPDMRITWNAEVDSASSLVRTSDGKVWIFWTSTRDGNTEIYYKTYDPSQTHGWSCEMRLTDDASVDRAPSAMQASDGKIWLVWETNRTGNYDIFYKTYNGSSWLFDTRLTYNSSRDEFPSIMQASDGKIWVVWDSSRLLTGFEIFYTTTADGGATWSPDTWIQLSKSGNWDPAVMQATDGKIWLVWTASDADVYYSTFSGTWSNAKALTSNPLNDFHPNIMQAADGTVWVVWDSDRISDLTDVYYSIYSGSWSGETRLTTNLTHDMTPSIVQSVDGVIWIAWSSERGGNFDVYYRNSLAIQTHDVEAFSIVPLNTAVVRGGNISVEVVARNKGTSNETVEIRFYVNSSLIGTQLAELPAGQLYPALFSWATDALSYGNYAFNATVTPVLGESNLADNIMSGAVKLTWAPVARFSNSPAYPLPTELVSFDASESTPDGGTLVSYKWDFGDGNVTTVSGPFITHRFTESKDYVVTLTVKDSDGPTATMSRVISTFVHDIAILWGNAYLDQSPWGLDVPYDVDVTNLGIVEEQFDVLVYFNSTAVGSTSLTLSPGETVFAVELWGHTSIVLPGYYHVNIVAGSFLGERNTSNNWWDMGFLSIYNLDLAVTSLEPSVSAAYVGQTVAITVTVRNEGTLDAHADLMLYYNSTLLETKYIFLVAYEQSDFVYFWDLSTVNPGVYLLRARVVEKESEFLELDVMDNERIHNSFQVKIPGDINGDKTVSSLDLSLLMSAYGSYEGHPDWNLACDTNDDGVVDVSDLFILGDHFGESNP